MPYASQHKQGGCSCERCEAIRASQRRYRAGHRVRPATYTPTKPNLNVRTYGEPWDSRIAAAAASAVPLPASPNRTSKR